MFQEFGAQGFRFDDFEITSNLFFNRSRHMLGNPGIAFVYAIANGSTSFLDSATVPIAAEYCHHDQQEHGAQDAQDG